MSRAGQDRHAKEVVAARARGSRAERDDCVRPRVGERESVAVALAVRTQGQRPSTRERRRSSCAEEEEEEEEVGIYFVFDVLLWRLERPVRRVPRSD